MEKRSTASVVWIVDDDTKKKKSDHSFRSACAMLGSRGWATFSRSRFSSICSLSADYHQYWQKSITLSLSQQAKKSERIERKRDNFMFPVGYFRELGWGVVFRHAFSLVSTNLRKEQRHLVTMKDVDVATIPPHLFVIHWIHKKLAQFLNIFPYFCAYHSIYSRDFPRYLPLGPLVRWWFSLYLLLPVRSRNFNVLRLC